MGPVGAWRGAAAGTASLTARRPARCVASTPRPLELTPDTGGPHARPPLPDDVRALLARPNPAVMATLAADGRPVTVATWYLVEDDGTVLLNLDAGRARLRHLRTDPRVSLTALAEGDWYTHVSVQGHVTSHRRRRRPRRHRPAVAPLHRPRRTAGATAPRVSVHVTVDRWHGWGAAGSA